MKKLVLSLFVILSANSAFTMDIEREELTLEQKNAEYYRCQADVITHIKRQFSEVYPGLPVGIQVTQFQGITPGRIKYSVSAQNRVSPGPDTPQHYITNFNVTVSRAHCGLVELTFNVQ